MSSSLFVVEGALPRRPQPLDLSTKKKKKNLNISKSQLTPRNPASWQPKAVPSVNSETIMPETLSEKPRSWRYSGQNDIATQGIILFFC